MHRLFREAIGIKAHLDNINREKGFKLNKEWNPGISLLRHSNAHRSGKCQEHRQKEEHATKETK
jgi:hypothetical protein